MPLIGRLVLFIYNIFMLAIAGAVIAISVGWSYPLTYLNAAASTPENRMIMGAVGIILAFIALITLIWGLKTKPGVDDIMVEQSTEGEVSISIPAAQAIIMRSVRQVEGIKELRPTVIPAPAGITVKLHTMINPDHNVPQTAQTLQTIVRDNLEKIGGLKVAEIKVLVDDFNAVSSK